MQNSHYMNNVNATDRSDASAMSTVALPMPKIGIRDRIVTHMQGVRDNKTKQLLRDILSYMETPYDMSWLRDEYCLSNAEFQVLKLLAQGQTPAEISAMTGKQVSTIRAQICKAYKKCRVSNMAELTALLLRRAANL